MTQYRVRRAIQPTRLISTSDDKWHIPDRAGNNSIQVDSHDGQWTGILDADGNGVYRYHSPIGFIRFEDEQ